MLQFPKSNQVCYDSPSSEVFKNFDTNTSLDLGQNLQTSLEQAEIWFEICCRLFVVDQKSKTYFFLHFSYHVMLPKLFRVLGKWNIFFQQNYFEASASFHFFIGFMIAFVEKLFHRDRHF